MRVFSAAALWAIIAVSVGVMWVDGRWATSLPEVASFLLAALWMAAFVSGRQRPRLSFALIPLIAMILWGVFQTQSGITIYRWRRWAAILYWSGNLAFFFTGLQVFSDPGLRTRFLRALLWFGFITSVVSTLQALTVNAKVYWIFQTAYTQWNVFGPFVYHNQYAAFIELILPIALYFAVTEREWRFVYIVMAAAMYASVVASGSRAGFVLTTAELGWVPFIALRGRRLKVRPVLQAGGALAVMVVILSMLAGPDLLVTKLDNPDQFNIRRYFNYASLAMIRARPVSGFGLGNWATAYPAYAVKDVGMYANQAHNDWAQWAVEGGLPFAAMMLLLAAWAIPRGLRAGWGAGVAAVFLHCAVDYPIQRTAVALVFFAMIAAVAYPAGRGVRRR